MYAGAPYARLRCRTVETTYTPSRPSQFPAWATPDAPAGITLAADDPPGSRRRRSAAAVALAGSSLILGPALWLGLAAWAASAGLVLLAVPLAVLGLLAAAVSAVLALRGAPPTPWTP